jgi:hypothetical protein
VVYPWAMYRRLVVCTQTDNRALSYPAVTNRTTVPRLSSPLLSHHSYPDSTNVIHKLGVFPRFGELRVVAFVPSDLQVIQSD